MALGENLGLTQASTGGCACGEHSAALPELDAQAIPHAIRHAAIKGALGSLAPGAGLVLSATHDPVPLLRQVAEEQPDAFAVEYLDRGPERWRLAFTRR